MKKIKRGLNKKGELKHDGVTFNIDGRKISSNQILKASLQSIKKPFAAKRHILK